MRHFLHAPRLQGIVIQPPSDIIVASEIIQECILSRKRAHNIHLLSQETDVPRGDCIPCGSHCCHIVEHVTLRLLNRTEIRSHLVRLHNNLSEQHDSRADNFTDHTHHTDDRVYLRKIPAVCTQLFPDIRHRIDTDDIHSLISQVQEVIHHLVEYARIAVVQIPLVRIECGHHIVAELRQISKVARRCCREHLRHRLFIFLRNGRICIEEIPAHIFPVSLARLHCPLMIL